MDRSDVPFVPGIELARRYYAEVVRPLLDRLFVAWKTIGRINQPIFGFEHVNSLRPSRVRKHSTRLPNSRRTLSAGEP